MFQKNKFLILAILFILTILINFVFSYIFMKKPLERLDSISNYLNIYRQSSPTEYMTGEEIQAELTATNLISGHGFSLPDSSNIPKPTMIREPMYSFFLSLIYMLFGHSFELVFFIQKVLLGIIAVLIYLITINIFEHKYTHTIAVITTIISAINIDLHYYSNLMMSEILFIFLLMLFSYLFIKALKHPSIIFYALSGLALGLCSLCKSIMSLYFIFVAFLIIYFCKRLKLKYLLIFLLFYFSTIMPWITRNYILFNYPAITTRVGATLWMRAKKLEGDINDLNRRALYTFSDKIGRLIYPDYKADYIYILSKETHEYKDYYKKLRDNFTEEEVDKISLKDALAKIRQYPMRYLFMSVYELASLNSFCLNPIIIKKGKRESISEFLRISYKILFLISIPLFFIGLFYIKRFNLLLLLFATIIYFNLSYSIISVDRAGMRYILPIVPFYLIFILLGLGAFLYHMKIVSGRRHINNF